MQNDYSINQSDGLSLNFMNKSLINILSDRGTERRALIWYNYRKILMKHGGVVVERRTPIREVLGSNPTSITVLCP